jgi:hypothetical protein
MNARVDPRCVLKPGSPDSSMNTNILALLADQRLNSMFPFMSNPPESCFFGKGAMKSPSQTGPGLSYFFQQECVFRPNAQRESMKKGRRRHGVMNDWSDEQTDDPLYADLRNFYKVEAWSRDGMHIDALLYAGNNFDKAREIFVTTVKHRPRIKLTIRQRTRVLQHWPP